MRAMLTIILTILIGWIVSRAHDYLFDAIGSLP